MPSWQVATQRPASIAGTPGGPDYEKATVCLYWEYVLFLGKVALAVRERTRKPVKRAELIRAALTVDKNGPRLGLYDENGKTIWHAP